MNTNQAGLVGEAIQAAFYVGELGHYLAVITLRLGSHYPLG